MQVGQTITLDFDGLSRAAVADPKVVDVAALSSRQLLLSAKAPGSTTLDAWDKHGQATFLLIVKKSGPELAELVASINRELVGTGVTARQLNENVVLEGTVKDPAVAKRAEAIATSFVPTVRSLLVVTPVEVPQAEQLAEVIRRAMQPTVLNITGSDKLIVIQGKVTPEDAEKLSRVLSGITRLRVVLPGGAVGETSASIASDDLISVINLVTTSSYDPRQLLVRAQVLDIDHSALKELGVEWGALQDGSVSFGHLALGEARPAPLALNEGGPIRRLDLLGVALTALITENKARILSEPNVLVMEGQRANIHLGGEIPVPVVQSAQAGTAAAITIQWKKFGVDLDIEGRIGADGRTVDLMVSPEVSELDNTLSVMVAGVVVPGLRSRSASTKVHLPAGQTLVIGGLLQNVDTKTVRRIPLLSQLPVIGEFFKSTRNQHQQRELVILMTPEIVTATELVARAQAAVCPAAAAPGATVAAPSAAPAAVAPAQPSVAPVSQPPASAVVAAPPAVCTVAPASEGVQKRRHFR